MKHFALLTLTTTLLLTACGTETEAESEPAATTAEAETETTAETEDSRPVGLPDITDQLDVDQWTDRIQDKSIIELNDDGIPLYATDNEYEVLLTDGVLEPGYSMIAPIEDARYACYILAAAINNVGELDLDILDGIVAAQHLAQLGRIENDDYPDVQEYDDDDSKPNAHTKAAIIHLCPDTIEYFDDEMAATPPFSEAIAELS